MGFSSIRTRLHLDDAPHATSARITLPAELEYLGKEIETSRAILDLADDWDEEGSPGYAEATWRRAVDLLIQDASRVLTEDGVGVAVPDIAPGPNGSVDLHWRRPGRELLLNVPSAHDAPAHYYGDDGAGASAIEGALHPGESSVWLMRWLMA